MNLNINKYILSLIFTGFIFILIPSTTYANEINTINKYFGITQQKTVINYEKSQPSSIDNPVVDLYSYRFVNCSYNYPFSNMVVFL